MKLYMRNGTVIKTADKNVKVTHLPDGQVERMAWDTRPGDVAIFIDVTQVLCVVEQLSFLEWLKLQFRKDNK